MLVGPASPGAGWLEQNLRQRDADALRLRPLEWEQNNNILVNTKKFIPKIP